MKTVKIAMMLLAALAMVSCSDFLELKHESNISADDFNRTEDELYTSLVGCYNGMQGALYREWAMTELRSDNTRIYARTSSTSIFDVIRQLDLSTIQPINYLVDEYWAGNYHNIERCNTVLRDYAVVGDEVLRNQYKAEAMFIRAYHYFNLVRLFGGVFLVTEPVTAQEARYMQRSNPDLIYDRIIADLREIVDNAMLPDTREGDELGRITMPAAKALLAKVYMTHYAVGTEEYAKARPLLEEVIATVGNPQTAADLVPYADIFDINNEMNREIIFAVRYKAGNLGLGSPFGNEFAPANSGTNVINGSGRSYNYPSTSIIDAFNAEPGDLRKDVSMAEKYYNQQTDMWVDDDETTQCRYVKKYLSPVETVDDGESDWPVIRVGDVLLLYAEIVNELEGPTPEAVNCVNMIRGRAGLQPLSSEKTANSYVFRTAIRNERRLELAFENQRWFDLLRWGIAVDLIGEHYRQEFIYSNLPNDYQPTIVEWQTLLPIPLNVMNINPELTQNYGY